MFCVVVTYGTVPSQAYVTGIKNYGDAEKLQDAAKMRGYKDARILNEKDFFEARWPHGRSSQRAA